MDNAQQQNAVLEECSNRTFDPDGKARILPEVRAGSGGE